MNLPVRPRHLSLIRTLLLTLLLAGMACGITAFAEEKKAAAPAETAPARRMARG